MQVEIQLRRFEHFGQVSPLAQPAQGGVYTEAPDSRSNGVILLQHQPPCQAPCTSTRLPKYISLKTYGASMALNWV